MCRGTSEKKQNEASLQRRSPTTLTVRVLCFSSKNIISSELLVWCLPFLISLFLPDQWLCNMPHWPITNILTLAGVTNTSIVPLMCTKSARSHSILQLWQPRIPQNGVRQVFFEGYKGYKVWMTKNFGPRSWCKTKLVDYCLDIWRCIFPVVGKGNLPGKKISPEDLKWFQHHTSHSTKAIGIDYHL